MNWTLFGVILIALAIAYRLLLGWSRRLDAPMLPSDFAVTADGVQLALYRRANPGAESVVMIHGLGGNHYNFDFPHAGCPARLYHEAGYDVWTVDLRGHGNSSHPSGAWYQWSFDDFVRFDIPAIVAKIRAVNNGAPLHWVGHSMGGMLFYAWAGTCEDPGIASAVTIGSPVSLFRSRRLERWAVRNRDLLEKIRVIPINTFLRWINPLLPWCPKGALESQMQPSNVDWQVIHKAAYHATNNTSIQLLLDFGRWIVSGEWMTADGQTNYREAMKSIRVPTLVMAGSRDKLAPPARLRLAFDCLGSEDKEFVIMGREEGRLDEYGHIDLVFGRRAASESIAAALQWTNQHRVRG